MLVKSSEPLTGRTSHPVLPMSVNAASLLTTESTVARSILVPASALQGNHRLAIGVGAAELPLLHA